MDGKRSNILTEAQEFAEDVLSNQLSDDIRYHSISHTHDVVNAVLEIARQSNLDESDMEIVELAAWFHDLGYREVVENHERVSANMALDFLAERNYDDVKAAQVAGCIMATQIPQTPKNKLEAIVCDADMIHLARRDYFDKADLLHNEIQQMKGREIADVDWLEASKKFIDNHQFFTDYARSMYAESKGENLRALKQRLHRVKNSK